MTDQQGYEAKLRAAERAHDQATETFHRVNEAAIRDAQAAIRIILVINGGAAIAVLAFVGSLVSKGYSIPQASGIISNSLWFVFGVMATAFAASFAYLTNLCYAGSLASLTPTWDHPYFDVIKVVSTRSVGLLSSCVFNSRLWDKPIYSRHVQNLCGAALASLKRYECLQRPADDIGQRRGGARAADRVVP